MQDILSNNLTIINPNNSSNLNPLIANPTKWSNILKAIREQFAELKDVAHANVIES